MASSSSSGMACDGALRPATMVRQNDLQSFHPVEPGWVFNNIFSAFSAQGDRPDQLMIDAMQLKAHQTAASLLEKAVSRRTECTKGGPDAKLHAVCDDVASEMMTQGLAIVLPNDERTTQP